MNLPTPAEYIRMPWHAKARLRRLMAERPAPQATLTYRQGEDLNTIISLLDKMLTDDYQANRRSTP